MELTMQQAFDQAYAGVMTQGHKSQGVHGGCAYRGAGGSKCGVGQLITDEEYTIGMDGSGGGKSTSIYNVIDLFPARVRALPMDFLAAIQRAHDGCGKGWNKKEFEVEFHHHMEIVARDWKLKMPEPMKEAA